VSNVARAAELKKEDDAAQRGLVSKGTLARFGARTLFEREAGYRDGPEFQDSSPRGLPRTRATRRRRLEPLVWTASTRKFTHPSGARRHAPGNMIRHEEGFGKGRSASPSLFLRRPIGGGPLIR
jgi:hypothetical protein